ncbi:MAG: DUF3299 domain-containing protein [Alphaproteobacteria bacterium]|jgi:hypothetical protein|nr:DUF3299 domain-containing protein [Alphaproteobacteria bacterium]
MLKSRNAKLSFAFMVLACMSGTVWADAPVDIGWEDLLPAASQDDSDFLEMLGIVEHGESVPPGAGDSAQSEVVTEYSGKTVRLPGYLVPLDLGVGGGTEFLLVPYFGACIHVPPPPPNQIVHVTTERAYAMESLFEPVYVTGRFEVAKRSTELADAAYALAAEDIQAYVVE